MPTNVYFTQGTRNEQILLEDLIIESLQIYGQELYYIPRTLVAKDNILGEDRLSEFKTAFPIEMYFENVDSFDGQGAFIQKFGLFMEQSATLVVARRRWDQLVGRYGVTTIPIRPNEGDLLYFPLTKGLFEIKFVKHQDPFYQLGKLYVYKLQVELFQYSSEKLDTGISEIDVFESLKTFATDPTRNRTSGITAISVIDPGYGYSYATINISATNGYGTVAAANINDSGNIVSVDIINPGVNYSSLSEISISVTGDGQGALLAASQLSTDIDIPNSYGDNNKFAEEGSGVMFTEGNPFGDVTKPKPPLVQLTSDTTDLNVDTTTISADSFNITVDEQINIAADSAVKVDTSIITADTNG